MRPESALRQVLLTLWNALLYLLSGGRIHYLEGRFRGGSFHNWAYKIRFRPARFVQPDSLEGIVAAVRGAKRLRVVGAGHSFNRGTETEDLLLNLDRYAGILSIDLASQQVRVRGGTRVRDLSRALYTQGLAFRALPSHDAQSIAGILSTDVHGTGREQGWVSQSVLGLRIVDGRGEICDCVPGDDLFAAAIGGIGAVGVIVEVSLQVTTRFRLRQRQQRMDRDEAWARLPELLAAHDHCSFYFFPFAKTCFLNTWDRTEAPLTPLGRLREALAFSFDAVASSAVGNLLAATGLLPRWAERSLQLSGKADRVMESFRGYNRTVYSLHQELEFAVDQGRAAEVWARFNTLYEQMYDRNLPYTLIEVRFTPAGHHLSLLSPGRERASAWIDLLANQVTGYERYFSAAEALMREVDARPHLGKWSEALTVEDLARVHGEHFERFAELRRRHDPEERFVNAFTRQRFGA